MTNTSLDAPRHIGDVLEGLFEAAERAFELKDDGVFTDRLPPGLAETIRSLARANHQARGAALTLLAHKSLHPEQDIRQHQSKFPGGFNARSLDTEHTVPFLHRYSLLRTAESHWMTRTLANAPYTREHPIPTNPKVAGEALVEAAEQIEVLADPVAAECAAGLIIFELIAIRNRSKVELTRPKGRTIDFVVALLNELLARKYEKNSPRVPQLAVYALYECLVDGVSRYAGHTLDPLMRMKAADRKSGTVGDIVVSKDISGSPVEAVETKLDQPVTTAHISDAVAKLETASVQRYFILSTAGTKSSDRDDIDVMRASFLHRNGCEIIVGDLLETIAHGLRYLDVDDYINALASRMEIDPDLGYDHRIAWNEVVQQLSHA